MPRRPSFSWLFGIALATLAVILGLSLASSGIGAPATAVQAAPAAAGTPIAANFGLVIDAVSSQAMSRANEIGTRYAWHALNWGDIQPTAGNCTTTPALCNAAAVRNHLESFKGTGIQVILMQFSVPTWAADQESGVNMRIADSHLADFQGYMQWLANEIKVNSYPVTYFEMFNEPDFFDPTSAKARGVGYGNYPEAYAKMLRAAWNGVKAVDPSYKIAFGGVAAEKANKNLNFDFVKNVFAVTLDGGKHASDYFDVMNVHTYPNFAVDVWNNPIYVGTLLPPEAEELARAATYSGMVTKVQWLDKLMQLNGFRKPIIVTEWGIPAGGTQVGTESLNEDNQVQVAIQGTVEFVAVNHDASRLPQGLPANVLFTLSDNDNLEARFGVTDSNYQPKKAFNALKYLNSRLSGANFIGRIPESWWDPNGPKVDGFRFEQNGQEFAIVWSRFNAAAIDNRFGIYVTAPSTAITLTNYARVDVTNVYGTETTVYAPNNGKIVVPVNGTPIYLQAHTSLPTATPTAAEKQVTLPAGTPTVVSTDNNTIQFSVPGLTNTVNFTYRPVSSKGEVGANAPTPAPTAVPTNQSLTGERFQLEITDPNGTPVTTFPTPIGITYNYDPNLVGNTVENTLQLYYWDPVTQQWLTNGISSTVNTSTNQLTAQITHTTEFALIGQTAERRYLPMVLWQLSGGW